MNACHTLYQSIYPDAASHPERIPATLERIQDVAQIVLGEHAPDCSAVLSEQMDSQIDIRASLADEQAHRMAERLAACGNDEQILRMAELIGWAELSASEAVELHEKYKIPVSHLEKDIVPVSGEGSWVRAIDGKTYLDLDSNYSATNLGLSNADIAKALYNQAMQLISMKEDRVHVPRARFLKTFQGMLPPELTQFYWQNSGGEAVDKSLKLAKAYTGQTGVVAFEGGFHGRTHGAIAVTENEAYRKPFGLTNLNWIHFVPFNDADAVEAVFAAGKARIVILELVQGEEAGVRPADPDFVRRLRRICDAYDGVLICDEVQTGFGRVAQKEGQWFACQNYGIVPDIITIGKSFGGGYPVTAVVTHKRISQAMKPGYDGSTFGGNPMAMVAATVATRQMREKNLTRNVVLRSAQFAEGFRELQERFQWIGELRIVGLSIGFDLPSAADVALFQQRMAEHGVKTSLSTHTTVRFLPLLIITEEEIRFLLNAMSEVFHTFNPKG